MKKKFQREANKYLEWNVLICAVCRKSRTGKKFLRRLVLFNETNKIKYFDTRIMTMKRTLIAASERSRAQEKRSGLE